MSDQNLPNESASDNRGQFKPGQSGNPKGRPRGKKAEIPQNIKDFIAFFVHKNMRTVERNFKKLTPNQQMQFLLMSAKFVVPTKTENASDGEVTFKFVYDDENEKTEPQDENEQP